MDQATISDKQDLENSKTEKESNLNNQAESDQDKDSDNKDSNESSQTNIFNSKDQQENNEEVDFNLSEDQRQEEQRLIKDRLTLDEQEKLKDPNVLAALDKQKFSHLDSLLTKVGMYSQFLSEQFDEEDQKVLKKAQDKAEELENEEKKLQDTAEKASGKKRGRRSQRQQNKANKEQKKDLGEALQNIENNKQKLTDEDLNIETINDGDIKRLKTEGTNASKSFTKALLPYIEGDLRDYQMQGVRWMISLYKNGINGILADQMGLGKTIQTIGFLSYLKSKGVQGPFMVIGPLSTLHNWYAEVTKWCPSIHAIIYHGNKEQRAQIRRQELPNGRQTNRFPLVITSYEVLIADRPYLERVSFKYVVVDEGHRLKNYNSRLVQELFRIQADNKLLLTGTPLQNNLSELWSLLHFILPDLFSDLSEFERWFDFSDLVGDKSVSQEIVAAEQRNHVVSKLHTILKPFLLRRVKSDVEQSLPRKIEIIFYAHMTEFQKNIENQLIDQLKRSSDNIKQGRVTYKEDQDNQTDDKIKSRFKFKNINNLVMQLRKNCNHPDLLVGGLDGEDMFPEPPQLLEQGGKLFLLNRLVTLLHKKGHKILIFSQMTKMLDIIESFYSQLGVNVCRIDGSVKWQDRQQNIEEFSRNDETYLFLLSTRAGGLGINLTAADTVIIFDSDWNPHQDMQAMDRAHRIGQTKPVLVLRLATANSIEGKMLTRANEKMLLEKLVIKQGAFKGGPDLQNQMGQMSTEELVKILHTDQNKFSSMPQSGTISDKLLDQILDRTYLAGEDKLPFAGQGVGYEVVDTEKSGNEEGILESIQN